MKKKVLITGGSGFIGRYLISRLLEDGYCLSLPLRRIERCLDTKDKNVEAFKIEDVDAYTDYKEALRGVRVVIHLAGRAHILHEDKNIDPISEFRRINVEGTLNLAKQALKAGVRRFIFISSIGVNGSESEETGFTEESEPNPIKDYAVSKLEAEIELRNLIRETGMELVTIRPPLVYGKDAPANFNRLLRLVRLSLPLPFKALKNKRSLISVENLADFICLCVEHKVAGNELFLISEAPPISTADMIERLSEGMGVRSRIFYLPKFILQVGSALIGRQDIYSQLCGSLVVNSDKARSLLGWRPVEDSNSGLVETGRHYLLKQSK